MRLLKPPTSAFLASLKQLHLKQSLRSPFPFAASSSVSSYFARRHYAANRAPRQDVAIIGSGITGLTTAYYLSKSPNPPNVTIYEASPRVGGWLNSKYVDVEGGRVLFEQGPRSLRPAMPRGFHTAALIEDIGLADEMIFVPKDSPSARDRWLYYPDHLVHVPHPTQGFFKIAQTLFTEEAFQGLPWAVAAEFFKANRPDDLEDESVGDFISRRLSKEVVDRVLSGVLHGIYAGDAYQLSAKSLFPEMWFGEREHETIITGFNEFKAQGLIRQEDFDMIVHLADSDSQVHRTRPSELDAKLNNSSVFTLKRGLMSMTERMESLLSMVENVKFKTKSPISYIRYDQESQKMEITPAASSGTTQPATYDQVISTIFSHKVSHLVNPGKQGGECLLPSFLDTSAVTVSVVNLYYPDPNLLPIRGFGYLIPQATPFAQNPELALGVVFDSEITREQDTAPGTKVTVMLGGHWWDGWETLPTDDELVEKAKSILNRHLGITGQPEAFHVGTQKDCIPQYTFGHVQRMKDAHYALLRNFGGRLKVAGNSYTGVGVNDCLMAAREIALATQADNWSSRTGLETFESDQKFVSMKDLPKR
ncbi:protoporphyrinogen oxidase [Venturia nashicola]|nr:protoporphyrinogen oxidase [Venturia nashicola]